MHHASCPSLSERKFPEMSIEMISYLASLYTILVLTARVTSANT